MARHASLTAAFAAAGAAVAPGRTGFLQHRAARGSTPRHAARPLRAERTHPARALVSACASEELSSPTSPEGFPGLDPDLFTEDEVRGLQVTTLRWREIPFKTMEEELAAIDEYVKEEELEDENPWARFLRGAAYEHWGRPSLAAAQYDLVRYAKGLRLVPDLWVRKAYNAFKLGDVGVADRFHDIASLIRSEALGNQMHFSFWFETEFADFKPRDNGPPQLVQNGICKYCCQKFSLARDVLCPALFARTARREDLEHAALWLLAVSARMNSTIAVDATGLPENDVALARRALAEEGVPVSAALAPMAALFLDATPPAVEVAERMAMEGGEHALTRSFYMALYYDSMARDEAARDRWLDTVTALRAPECTHDTADFLFWTATNRLAVPPASAPDLPALEVPL
jgi:hypothetical protein